MYSRNILYRPPKKFRSKIKEKSPDLQGKDLEYFLDNIIGTISRKKDQR